MNRLRQAHDAGVSIWLDTVSRAPHLTQTSPAKRGQRDNNQGEGDTAMAITSPEHRYKHARAPHRADRVDSRSGLSQIGRDEEGLRRLKFLDPITDGAVLSCASHAGTSAPASSSFGLWRTRQPPRWDSSPDGVGPTRALAEP
jgi:hypothetical protein